MVDDYLRFLQNAAQMTVSPETLRIDLIDVFRPWRTRREPSAFRYYFQPTDGGAIARRVGEDGLDFFASQVCRSNMFRGESLQQFLL